MELPDYTFGIEKKEDVPQMPYGGGGPQLGEYVEDYDIRMKKNKEQQNDDDVRLSKEEIEQELGSSTDEGFNPKRIYPTKEQMIEEEFEEPQPEVELELIRSIEKNWIN